MSEAAVLDIAFKAIVVTVKVAAPILLVAMAIGFFISLIQSVTQIQEITLTFVPKLAGIALVLVVAGSWMLNELLEFTRTLFLAIPQLIAT